MPITPDLLLFVCHQLKKETNRTLGMLRRSLNGVLSKISSKTYMLLFNTVVRPILEYASQVWTPHQKGLNDKLEIVLRRAIICAYEIPKFDPDGKYRRGM